MLGCLANKRIVYLGDSTSRYEYLALAHLAEYGALPSAGHLLCAPHAHWPNFQQHDLLMGQWRFMRQRFPRNLSAPRQVTNCVSSWTEWDIFYRYTNKLLHGAQSTESCDCFRQKCCDDALENRIYVNARLNTSIAFF
eukprot:617485-Prymnesium_polylepis.1